MIFDFITFFHIFLPFRSDISIFPGQRTVHGVPYRRLGRFLKYRLVITGTLWKQNGPRESGSVVIGDLQFCYQKVSRRHGSRWLLECVFYLLSVVVFLRFRLMVKRFFFEKGELHDFLMRLRISKRGRVRPSVSRSRVTFEQRKSRFLRVETLQMTNNTTNNNNNNH